MKKTLLLIILFCGVAQLDVSANVSYTAGVVPQVENLRSFYRWRKNNGNLTTATWLGTGSEQITNYSDYLGNSMEIDGYPTITEQLSSDQTIRLRGGAVIAANAYVYVEDGNGGFTDPLTNVGGASRFLANITKITINSVTNAQVYYQEEGASSWTHFDGTSSSTAPFELVTSGQVTNGTVITNLLTSSLLTKDYFNLATEWNPNTTVLNSSIQSYTSGVNTYSTNYMGGAYYENFESGGKISTVKYGVPTNTSFVYGSMSGTNVPIKNTYTNKGVTVEVGNNSNTVTASRGITSSVNDDQQAYFPFELEVGLAITKYGAQYLKGKTFVFNVLMDVSYSGEGYMSYKYSGNGNTYGPFGLAFPSQSFRQADNNGISIIGKITIPNSIILPVKWGAFNVVGSGSSAVLNWNTSTEINNDYFNVTRSADGKTFSKIGTIDSKAANGNSNTPLSYSFTDYAPLAGTSYYRLTQVDKDGKSDNSEVRSFTVGGGSSNVTIAPNPVVSDFKVLNAKIGASYRLINMAGQVMQSGTISSNTQKIGTPYYPSGVYILQTQDVNGQNVSIKISKQ